MHLTIRFVVFSIFVFFSLSIHAQTTYTWNGGNGSWAVAANWSPNRTTPAATDILRFNDGGTHVVTAVPTQTIRQLLVTNNTNVTLTSSGTTTLTINGPGFDDNFLVEAGSTLQTSATNALTITIATTANQRGLISGTLTVRAGAFTTTAVGSTIVTVSASGVINHFGGAINGSVATLVFEDNATYTYNSATALTVPTANWSVESNLNITGVTTGIPAGLNQNFGKVVWDCPAQSTQINLATFPISVNSFEFRNTNNQIVGNNFGTRNWTTGNTGDLIITGGRFATKGTLAATQILTVNNVTVNNTSNANAQLILNSPAYTQNTTAFTNTLSINGNLEIILAQNNVHTNIIQYRGGLTTQTEVINLSGNFTQTGNFTGQINSTTATGNRNFIFLNGNTTYNAAKADILGTFSNVNITGSTVNFGNNTLTFTAPVAMNATAHAIFGPSGVLNNTGNFTTVAGSTLSLGSQDGITTTGATGNIQSTGTRTYNAGINLIYTGTNGQVTGNGQPAATTGFILLDLVNDTDELTFTNPTLSGNGVNVRIRSGRVANTLSFTNATASTLTYEGIAAQTSANNEFPATNGPRRLTINNPNGVTLHAARDLPANGILTLTSGILTTTTTNVLSVLNATPATAIIGGDATSYVNGPLTRAINAVGTYRFPVGDGAQFGGYSMITSAAASGVQLRVQHVNAAPGGSAGGGLSSIQPYHWRVERMAGTNPVNYTVELEIAGLLSDSRVGYSNTITGAYANQGGTNIGASITSVLSNTIDNTNQNAFYTIGTSSTLSGVVPALNLTVIADLLRIQLVTGNVIFELPTTYSGEPAYPVNFTEFTTNGPAHTVTIRPAAGSVNLLTAGIPSTTSALINLNGIDRLTFDGRAGGSGPIQWGFRNARSTATFDPTFRFINGATANVLRYLNIESQNTLTTSGTILFSTSTTLLGGNSENLIEFCEIRENTANNATPANGIHSSGTAGALNENNIIRWNNIRNYYVNAASTHSGVSIGANSTGWTIERNSFYQTVSRANGTTFTHTAVSISNTGDNFTVRHNYIGGSEPLAAGAALTYTGVGAGTFFGVDLNPATTATGCVVDSNVVANISFSRGTSSTAVSFVGIRNANGAGLIADNLIGSTSANGNITNTENFATTPSTSNGIINLAGNSTIERNTISGITLAGSVAGVGHSFNGILISGGICTVNENTIGSSTLANSIHCITASTNGSGQFLNGINYLSTAASTAHTISNNTIANLTNNAVSAVAASNIRGIATNASAAGGFTITGNTIFSLSVASASTGIDANSVNIGIQFQRTLPGQNISQNIIHTLSTTNTTVANSIIGIHYTGPTSGANAISRNTIHSFNTASNNAAAAQLGINALSGMATYHNNMIRLGLSSDGNAITNPISIMGIRHSSTTANNQYYYNTVLLAGEVASGTTNTFAFNRLAGTSALDVRNNIFINDRAQTSGTGEHFAMGLSTSAGVISNFNLYKADGQNGRVGIIATTQYPGLGDWQNVFGNDANSIYGPVPFVNALGDASQVNLRIDSAVPAQIESAGTVIASVSIDIDGDARGPYPIVGDIEGTAPDVGADEGNFIPADLTPPNINYTPIPTQTVLTPPSLTATITDISGVNGSSGTRPRLYYKYLGNANTFVNNTSATNGWKWVEATGASSPFTFNIDYSLLFGGVPSGGETIEYFVVAQDIAPVPNVGINSGTFNAAPSSVAFTAAAFPLTGTINSYFINVLSGVVTVGTSGMYPSLTNNGGLFEAINTGALSGDLIAEIISDLTAESGTHALNQWLEIGSGNYTLTIRPNNNTNRLVSGTYTGTTALNSSLIRFDGADRVIIDGRDPANQAAGGRHLTFRNINTGAWAGTFNYVNDAQNHTMRYIIAEGATASATNGVIRFSTALATGSGNDFITIDNCYIRDRSDAAGTPANGIYALGTTGRENDNITVSNCEIFNFWQPGVSNNGIFVAGFNSAWTIENNSFYQTFSRTGTGAVARYGIQVTNTTGDNFILRNNHIGGSEALSAGSPWTILGNVNQSFIGIQLNPANAAINCIVENNTIRNLNFAHGAAANAILFAGIKSDAGNNNIENNIIGGAAGSISIASNWNTTTASQAFGIQITAGIDTILNNTISGISFTGAGGAVGFTGIFLGSSGNAIADGNTINNISNVYSGNLGLTYMRGIATSTTGINVITNNTISNLSATTTITSTNANAALVGIADISSTTTSPQIIRGNTVFNLRSTTTGTAAVNISGIVFSAGTTPIHDISNNFVHSLSSATTGTTAVIRGIHFIAGQATISNNKIRMGIDGDGNSVTQGLLTYGIHHLSTTANISYFFNSVFVGGTGVANANNTFAFGKTAGTAATVLRNNIFVNNRSNGAGTGAHYAIGLTNSIAGVTSTNNILFAGGTGGHVGLQVATQRTTIADWQLSGLDANSFNENPPFLNATGNATLVNLRLDTAIPTQAESGGVDVNIYIDYDGDVRFGGVGYAGTGTAPDIGADENNFGGLDFTPPVITYTPIGTQTVLTPPPFSATITDNIAVETTPGLAPRIYYKRSTDANTFVDNTSATNGWKFIESSSSTSPFDFSINYTLLFGGGVSGGETIQYFVVAQDVAATPNFAVNAATFNTTPNSVVLTAANFPATGSINSYLINVLSGVVTVGSGGTYPSITNAGGLFQSINNAALSGNLVAEIISDLTAESGLHALNEWVELGAGNYTLTIRPSNNTARTISGNYIGANSAVAGLFRFDGADRVVIDGRDPNNMAANGRHLRFVNNNTNASDFNATFLYINDATNHTLRNSIIEGASTSATNGVIRIGTAGAGNGNDNITIRNNHIKESAGLPANGIFALGTATRENDNISILENELFNIWSPNQTSSAIWVSTNNSAWTITGNSIYQNADRTGTGAVIKYGIQVNNTGDNYTISDNHIGGTQANSSGTDMTITGAVNQSYQAIFLNPNAASSNSVVSGNTIRRINLSRGTAANAIAFAGINSVGAANTISNNLIDLISVTENQTTNANVIHGIYITSGNATVSGNTISNMQTLTTAGATSLIGISQVAGNTTISNNTIRNLTLAYTGSTTTYQLIGINLSGGVSSVTGNTLHSLVNNSTSAGSGLTATLIGINQGSNSAGQLISQNTIYGLENSSTTAATQALGILFRNATGTNEVSRNLIHSFNTPSTNSSASLMGVMALTGVATYHNNMIRLGIDVNGNSVANSPFIIGFSHHSATAGHQYYFNSVHIGGSTTSGSGNSIAFSRQANTAALDIKNNIFNNSRSNVSGTGKHYAISANSVTNFTSPANNSNFNILNAGGTGGFTGFIATTDYATLLNWQTATNQDANSLACDPSFINADGNSANVNLRISTTQYSAAEGNGTSLAINIDFDGNDRSTLTPTDIGAHSGNFIAGNGPTLSATANATPSSITVCNGSAVTLAANPSGGSGCSGTWEYSWSNGSLFWNGTAFALATPVFNSAYENINFNAPMANTTYTVNARCSTQPDCIKSLPSAVNVQVQNSPTTLTPTIGNPANGPSHFIELNWSSVAGVTAYEVEFSTNNLTWNSLYTGLNTSFSHNTGDSPNAPFYYRVRSVFGPTSCNWTNGSTFPIHTAADAPAPVVLSNATPFTMDVSLQPETPTANPATTTYSIFSPATNQFVQADGSLGATEVFQTMAAWGTTTIIGLQANTEYCFYARARNNDGDVREGLGGNVLPVEPFTNNANFSTVGPTGPSNVFWSPSTCTTGGLLYSATDGCPDGHVGRSGTFTNFFSCFLRTPLVNCTGNTSMKMFLDVSHSFFVSQPLDRMRFYMWADNQFVNGACTSIKINGVEVSQTDINGRFIPFNELRNCVNLEVTFDISSVVDKSAIFFYAEPRNGYNNSNLFSVKLDNVSMFGGPPPTCLMTAPLILNGDYTVGNGGVFPSITNPGGLFDIVNQATLSGNVTATIISDLTAESGTHALNEWAEIGVGNYTLTLRPSNNSDRLIEGNYVGANAAVAGLIRINGADRFIVDGRDPSNLAAGGRHLTFRNNSTTASNFNSTFTLINDAKNITIRNANIEAGTQGTLNGAVRISTASASGSGNDFITISHNHIRNLTNLAGQPSSGIYAAGTSTRVNDNVTISQNHFYNYHLASTSSHAAVYIDSHNSDYTISDNHIYMTATHTTTSDKYGILVSAATGNAANMVVTNNFIGGNSDNAIGTWQVNASGQDYRFSAISMSTGITAGNVVENNVIRNFNITTGTGFQTQGSTFTGILGSNGEYEIRNNTIGSLTHAGSITIACSAGQFTNVHGIFHSGNAAINVLNNTIGGINLSNTTSSANIVNMYGIRVGSSTISQSITVTGNTIGSADAPLTNATGNTFNATNGATIAGIHVSNARPTTVSNNLVNNIHYTANGTSSSATNAFSVIGIERVSAAAANNVIQNNVVHSLSTSSPYAQTGAVAALIGISHRSTSAGQTLKGNTVYGLTHTNASAAATVTGIYYNGPTSGTNLVDGNFVHSLNATSSSTALQLNGIVLGGGLTTVTNNMVRLGIDAAGNSITAARVIQGILKETANNHNIWHNSVYIGGANVVSGAANTFAFRRTATGIDNVRNNIFLNARSNATTGGLHYSLTLNATTTYTGGFNILFSPGTGGSIGSVNGGTTPLNFLGLLTQGIEITSGVGNPNFVNPTGNASQVDLHLQASNPAEGSGVLIASVVEDFDGEIRADFTPADIGADAANFNAIVPSTDIFPPQITFTPISGAAICSTPVTTLLDATIFDGGAGVPTTGANRPRAYFRRSAPTISAWASVPGTLVSGNQFNGNWQFELDYSLLSITPVGGETYQYYIVAQDLATNPVNPNLGLSHFDANVSFTNNNVNNPVTHPAAPSSFSFSNPLSGTVTVGSGGDFPSFNLNPGGLFHAINTRGLSGDLEVLVISNINETANWTPLNAPQEFCGSGYTITIRPNAPTLYTVEANSFAANAMFSFLGARRVIIDGRFDGDGRFLRLRHNRVTSIYASTVEYNNGANNNVLRSCIIEGANINNSNNTTGSVGVVRIGGSMGFASGNLNNITIQDNEIRNLSNVTPTLTNVPMNLIYLGGANNSANINNITITGNDMFNFQASAIRADNGGTAANSIGNNISITNNNIYQTLTIPTYQYPIVLDANGTTNGHVISGNKIGGSAKPNPEITGTWENNKVDGEVVAIFANVGNSPTQAEALSIQGNKIQNFNISGTGWTNFVGMRVQNGRVRIGDEVGNVIGSEDNSQENIISNGSGGSFITQDAAVMGIWTQSAEEVVIENNIVSGLSTGLGTFCFLDGIVHGSNLYFNDVLFNAPGGGATIRNNVIANNRSSSNLQNSAVSNEGMISLFLHTNSMNNLVEGNLIQNNELNAVANANVRNHGAMLGILGQAQNHGGIFRKNTIAALANANVGQASPNNAPEVNGLVLNYGNWEVSNNMISLRNGTTGTHIDFRNTLVNGIRDHLRNLTGQGANYLYNSVYIYGTNGGAGGANPSYCYVRIPNNTGTVAGAPVTLRNNIFINGRTGIGSHRAIGNINASVPATGWNSSASNYNFVATLNSAVATRWGTTDLTFANWRTTSGGDANSDYVPVAATTIANTQLNPEDLFETDFLFGNLRISSANPAASDFIDNKGTPLASVIDDIDGDPRDPFAPDFGADEFNSCLQPIVTVQPVDQLDICPNAPATFTATVIGLNPINFQWQESTDGGATWSNLSNAGIYSGVNTNTLNISAVSSGMNNNQYRLQANNACGNGQTNAVLLTLVPGIQITGYSPITFINSICSGNTNFSVTATGVGLTYQWQESTDGGTSWSDVLNVAPYSGATTNLLSFSNIPPPNLNGNKYRLIITDACGEELISNEGTLIIGVAFIDAQPVDEQTVCTGSLVNIDVNVSGLGLTYQWQFSTDNGSTWNNATAPTYSGSNTDNLSFTASSALNGYLYRVIVNSSVCPASTTSDASLLNVEFPGQWLGAGTDWDTPANWGCGTVPTPTTDVLIPTNPIFGDVFPVVSSASVSVARDLTIQTGASVTVQAASNLSLYGSLTNNGLNGMGVGVVRFVGNTLQVIDGMAQTEFGAIDINNSTTTQPAVELNQSIAVLGPINMMQGRLHLNGSDIDLLGTGSIVNESNANRIYGDLGEIKTVLNMAANTAYNNIFGMGVSITTGATAPGLTVIERGHFQHAHMGSYQSIQRYFDINPTVNTALDATLRINYFDDELEVTFGPPPVKANLLPWRSTDNGLTWEGQFFPSNLTNDIVNNWVQLSGIPAFSRWTLSDWINNPLPIQLLSFTATANYANQQVDLEWITASEINNAFFTVERSSDAQIFQPVLSRPGAGNSNTVMVYNDVDPNPLMGISYYRLKQTDFDGSSSYSQVVPVNFQQQSQASANVFAGEAGNVYLQYFGLKRGPLEVNIFDAGGRLIGNYQFNAAQGSNQFIIKDLNLATGVYIVRINDGQRVFNGRIFMKTQ
ncbi:MAG: beta strand repeat-containing protein [Flavobacteriales bacterium]